MNQNVEIAVLMSQLCYVSSLDLRCEIAMSHVEWSNAYKVHSNQRQQGLHSLICSFILCLIRHHA